jgi:hypothetical protein
MNDTLIQDSIKVAGQAIKKTTETGEQTNWWMWLAIAEFGIIAFLIYKGATQAERHSESNASKMNH